MPATIVQSKIGGQDGGNLGTATLDAATAEGNVLLIGVLAFSTPSVTGLTADNTVNGGSLGVQMGLFRKDAVAGESSWGVTYGGNGGVWCAIEIGSLLASPLDKVAKNTGGASGATVASGTTTATAQADELAIAMFGAMTINGATPSWSSYTNSFTELRDGSNPVGSSAYRMGMGVAIKDLSATGTQTCTATPSVSTYNVGMITTYKAAASGPAVDPGQFLPFFGGA